MTTRSIFRGMALCAALLGGAGLTAQNAPPAAPERQITGTVEGKGFKRIPIAIPTPESEAAAAAEAAEFATTLRDDLTFSGLFEVVPPSLYTKVANAPGVAVPYDDWLGIGADAVVLARLGILGNRVDLQARLHETTSRKVTLGRRLGGTTDLLRRVAHQLADEIVQLYTGRPGVAMTRIAFVSKHEKGKEIYLMDYDGQRVRRLTTTGTLNLFPVWSPDGERLAFVSWRGRQPGIHIMDAEGKLTAVPVLRGELNSTPDWTPDGKRLVFSSDMEGNSDIYLLDVGTNRTTRLTRSNAIDTSPDVSPNGREVAFTSDRSGTPQIYVMGIDGLNVRRVSTDTGYSDSPSWSPRGDRIAFATRVDGRFHIATLELATDKLTYLTSGNHNNEDPRWAPDGRHLVFSSNRAGSYDIHVMAADGSDVRRLTRGMDAYTPDWSH